MPADVIALLETGETEDDVWARDVVPARLDLAATLVCAGLLAFLGIIDVAYVAKDGMFARERDGLTYAFLVVAVLSLALVLVLAYA